MSVMSKLKGKNEKPNVDLLQIAREADIAVSERDKAFLGRPQGFDDEAGQAARERLLLRLDSYEAKKRSKLSQTLAFASVVLSIISALFSIYASFRKLN